MSAKFTPMEVLLAGGPATTSDKVMIYKEEYERLLADQLKLSCLDEAGVDNWTYYGDAMELLESRKREIAEVINNA